MKINFFNKETNTGLKQQAPYFLLLNLFLSISLLILFVYPFLLGNTLYYRDVSHNYYPLLQFMKESLQQGQLPFWNPFLFWGTPQIATLEPPLFYPFAWFFFVFDFGLALVINLSLHYLLAAWGMYFFLKSYQIQPWAQIYGALIWSMSGALISLNHMHPLLNTVVWIPWLFLCARQFVLSKNLHLKHVRLIWGLFFSFVIALQLLSGHLEIVYFTSLSGFVYVLFIAPISKKGNARSLFLLLCFFCLGVGLAAIQLVPSFAFMPDSLRAKGVQIEEAQYFSFHPFHVIGLFTPRFLGDLLSLFHFKPILGDPKLGYNLLLYSCYLGASTFCFSCLSFLKKWKETYFWIGLAMISFLAALGKYFYLYALAWHYIPGFEVLRYPEKLIIFSVFSLCVLAAFGLDALYQLPWLKIRTPFVFLFGVNALLLFAAYFYSFNIMRFFTAYFPKDYPLIKNTDEWFSVSQNALSHSFLMAFVFLVAMAFFLYCFKIGKIKVQMASFLLFTLVSTDLLYNSKSQIWSVDKSFYELQSVTATFLQKHLSNQYAYFVENKSRIPSFFLPMYKDQPLLRSELFGISHLRDNFGMTYDLKSAFGFLPLRTLRSDAFHGTFLQKKIKDPSFENTYLSLLSVKYRILVAPSPEQLKAIKNNPAYKQVDYFLDTLSYVFENKQALPRARFQYQSIVVNTPEDAFRIWGYPETANYTPQKHVILVNSDALKQAQQQVPSQESAVKKWSKPEISNETAQAFDVNLENNTSGYLVLTDQYMPGWKAYDNGVYTPILQANFLQRAIRIGPGKHTIHFVYEPPGFALGWKLSLLSTLLVLLLFFWGIRQYRSGTLAVEMSL